MADPGSPATSGACDASDRGGLALLVRGHGVLVLEKPSETSAIVFGMFVSPRRFKPVEIEFRIGVQHGAAREVLLHFVVRLPEDNKAHQSFGLVFSQGAIC